MNFTYSFPVVKGVQANTEYYIAMVPLQMIEKLFPTDEDYVLPEYRAQRRLNTARIPEIKKYIINNRDSYVFSALAASIDGEYKYIESNTPDLGILEVSMNARFLINDGQHRKAAILEAIKEDETLLNETISIVFYEDRGLSRSQQMFTDLNKHAVKTSNSISELYDSRDNLAVVTRNVINSISFLSMFVDKERDMLGKYSSSLFTLNNFYNANRRIYYRKNNDYDEAFLTKYWNSIVDNMIPWRELLDHQITKRDLREQYIATQAVIIQAFGKVGYYFAENNIDSFDSLSGLRSISWLRNNPIWIGRVIRSNGRMITNENAITLASIVIKKACGLKLTDEEIQKESVLNGESI